MYQNFCENFSLELWELYQLYRFLIKKCMTALYCNLPLFGTEFDKRQIGKMKWNDILIILLDFYRNCVFVMPKHSSEIKRVLTCWNDLAKCFFCHIFGIWKSMYVFFQFLKILVQKFFKEFCFRSFSSTINLFFLKSVQ